MAVTPPSDDLLVIRVNRRGDVTVIKEGKEVEKIYRIDFSATVGELPRMTIEEVVFDNG